MKKKIERKILVLLTQRRYSIWFSVFLLFAYFSFGIFEPLFYIIPDCSVDKENIRYHKAGEKN